ncbi:MAG TPA: hypothetical protein VF630_01305 [Hymenobacter sp.]
MNAVRVYSSATTGVLVSPGVGASPAPAQPRTAAALAICAA